jgi:hypothetical protein
MAGPGFDGSGQGPGQAETLTQAMMASKANPGDLGAVFLPANPYSVIPMSSDLAFDDPYVLFALRREAAAFLRGRRPRRPVYHAGVVPGRHPAVL